MKKEMKKEIKKENAIESGQDYFDEIKSSLERALEEVKRKEEHWKEAINNGNFPDGRPLPNDLKIKKIEWTVDYIGKIDPHYADACAAIAQLAVAFDIEY